MVDRDANSVSINDFNYLPSSFSNKSKKDNDNKFNEVVRLQNPLQESSSEIDADLASDVEEDRQSRGFDDLSPAGFGSTQHVAKGIAFKGEVNNLLSDRIHRNQLRRGSQHEGSDGLNNTIDLT